MKQPNRGLALIRKPVVTNQPGRIQLLEKTVEGWTLGQAELIAIGEPELPEDDEEPEPLDPRLVPGAWLLTRFRNWVASDIEGEYFCRHSDIIAVLRLE